MLTLILGDKGVGGQPKVDQWFFLTPKTQIMMISKIEIKDKLDKKY